MEKEIWKLSFSVIYLIESIHFIDKQIIFSLYSFSDFFYYNLFLRFFYFNVQSVKYMFTLFNQLIKYHQYEKLYKYKESYDKGSHIDWTDKYIQKVSSWNTGLLITQLTITNNLSLQENLNFFKNVQLPNLQQITIYFRDLLDYKNDFGKKKPDSCASIAFLNCNGLCKRLRTLSLRGQTMPLQIAKNLVDLDFLNLKSLYIGFQADLTEQIISILICSKFSNLPLCTIYIATWNGEINTRLRYFYDKIKFIPLQQGEQQIAIQQLKYRARQLNFNHSGKQSWKQCLGKDLKNYFQNQQHGSSLS